MGTTVMEYALYIIFCALLLGLIFYVVRHLFKRNQRNELPAPADPLPLDDEPEDDFMCLLKNDGSSIAISKGVVVTGKRLK
jgi:cbb3-type cytochrome oxidase subunit 3